MQPSASEKTTFLFDPLLQKNWELLANAKEKDTVFYNPKKNVFKNQSYGNWFTYTLKVLFVSPVRYMFGFTSNRDVVYNGLSHLIVQSERELKELISSGSQEGLELKKLMTQVSEVSLPLLIKNAENNHQFREASAASSLKDKITKLLAGKKINLPMPKPRRYNSLLLRNRIKTRLPPKKTKSLNRPGVAEKKSDQPPPLPPATPAPAPPPPPPPPLAGPANVLDIAQANRKKKEEKELKKAELGNEIKDLQNQLQAKKDEIEALKKQKVNLQKDVSTTQKEIASQIAKIARDKNYSERKQLIQVLKVREQEITRIEKQLEIRNLIINDITSQLAESKPSITLKYRDGTKDIPRKDAEKILSEMQAEAGKEAKELISIQKEVSENSRRVQNFAYSCDGLIDLVLFDKEHEQKTSKIKELKFLQAKLEKESLNLEKEKNVLNSALRNKEIKLAELENRKTAFKADEKSPAQSFSSVLAQLSSSQTRTLNGRVSKEALMDAYSN